MPLVDTYLMQARRGATLQADMSTLKHFWPCTETAGDTLTDTQGGCVFAPADDNLAEYTYLVDISGDGANTLTANTNGVGWGFTTLESGESVIISGGSGATALRGTYTAVTSSDPDILVVAETVPSGTLTSPTIRYGNSRGQLEFDSTIGAVFPRMAENNTGLGGSTSRDIRPVELRAGTWTNITATQSIVLMYSARVRADELPEDNNSHITRFALGDNNNIQKSDTSGCGIGLSNGRYHYAITDGSGNTRRQQEFDNVSLGYLEDGDDYYRILKYEPGGTETDIAYDLSDYSEQFNADSTPITGTLETIRLADYPYIRIQGLKLYGAALFVFDNGLPDDIDEAARWMAWAWKNNYRIPYPGAVNWT